ncbi:MAG: hypothetical protein Q8L05_00155 [Actinomycetota bacterium]|nr:hypothetical protein [Actinomycetota bacterium]MDP2287517.1 hypothetical protein [Actinomycetota bacterium]
MPRTRISLLRSIALATVALASATALVAGSIPAQAARVTQSVPAALNTCQPPSKAFVSLEVAPELTGAVPVRAGYHRLWDMAVAWKDINPSNGVFNWTVLDQRVAQAEASGAVPMLVLGLTPQWAATDPSAGDPRWGLGSASPPSDFNTYRTYVDAVVSRYGGRIGAYEVWNEANLVTFWTGTTDQMAQITKIASDTIKAKNPSAIITAASVTTRLRSPMARFVTPYVQALKTLGYPFDAWAIHTYPAGDKGPEQRKSDIQNWQQVVSDAAGPGSPALNKQVWDTEVNYGLAGPGATPHTDYSDAQGADLVTQTFADSLALGIDATFWYLYTAAPFSLLGVQFWSGTPLTTAAWVAARAKYSAGANLCASSASPGSSGSSSSPTPNSSAVPVAKSITIVATCAVKGRLTIAGSSTGLAGSPLAISRRTPKKTSYVGRLWKPVSRTTLAIAGDGSINFGAAQKSPACGKAGFTFKVKAAADDITSNVVTVTTK